MFNIVYIENFTVRVMSGIDTNTDAQARAQYLRNRGAKAVTVCNGMIDTERAIQARARH